MTTTTTLNRRRPHRHLGYAAAVLPLLRWLVATHAVPASQPWRTHCEVCATAVWPDACSPSGRCRTCRTPIGAKPFVVEVIAAAAFGVLVWSGTRGWELAAYIWWTAGMLALAIIDAAVQRLPHRLTLATTAGTVLLLAPAGAPASSWRTATIGAAVLAGFYALIHIASHGDLGLGDVAVAVPVGFAVGWLDWRLIIVAIVLGHSFAAATIPLRRLTGMTASSVPLGAYLIAGSYLVVVAVSLFCGAHGTGR